MELETYVRELQRRLVESAESSGDDIREAAERLVFGLDATARLVLLDVLSAAASEITRDLAPGSVDVRLRGRDVAFVLTSAPSEGDTDEVPAPASDLNDASTSRTTIRLPDSLKLRVDDAAAADGLSVNTWMVRAIADALQGRPRRSPKRAVHTGDSFAGWAG